MSKWPVPTKKKEVQAFLGFANHYRLFIENYSAKARPLIDLTKDVPFSWGHQQQQAFDELRTRFLSAPILRQFDRTIETIMETDASNLAIAGMLSQYQSVLVPLHDRIPLLHPLPTWNKDGQTRWLI